MAVTADRARHPVVTAVSGATKTTFTSGAARRGTRITVRVTAYRTGHTAGVAWTRSAGAGAG